MLCQEKKRPKGAAATICRIDLYIVGSRQIFAVKILDVVSRKKRPKGAAATICRIDLYIVGLRQIFTVKILDVVGVVILPRSTDQENK